MNDREEEVYMLLPVATKHDVYDVCSAIVN